MTVGELIEALQAFPPNMLVAYGKYSEFCLMEVGEISLFEACMPRPDGWIERSRPDKPSREYLMFPGY